MAKKKNKPVAPSAALNEKAYLSSGRARSLPIYKCLVNEGWAKSGLAQVFVLRKHVNGHVTAGIYLVDLLCAGVKSTFYYFNIPEHTFNEKKATNPLENEACSYELAHNIIYGGVAFAEEYHIDPDPDFKLTQKILEEDTEAISLLEVEFGRDGKPVLMINPDDTRSGYYQRQLERYAGVGNYEVVNGLFFNGDEEDEDGDDEYLAKPELWDEYEWDEFIMYTTPEQLRSGVANYIYDKTTPIPLEAAPFIAAATALPPVTISPEALPEFAQSAAEKDEEAAVQALLDLEDIPESDLAALPQRLQENITRWPHNPVFYECLIDAQELQENLTAVDETIRALYEKFPDYLQSKLNYADLLIRQEQLDQVPAVFNNQYHLGAVYPDRSDFYISEFLDFNTFMISYFLAREELYTANFFLNQLEAVEIPEDLPVNFSIIIRLNLAILAEVKKVLLAARGSKESKQELISQLLL